MKSLAKFFASGFGSGYAPVAPGTAGSIVASLAIYVICTQLGINGQTLLIGLIMASIVGTIIGVISCNILESEWGKDPSKVVLDEMVGIFISLLFVPISISTILLSLVLFRVFDIWKPLGIRQLESIDGGVGVMADDILAGVYANIVLQIILYLNIL